MNTRVLRCAVGGGALLASCLLQCTTAVAQTAMDLDTLGETYSNAGAPANFGCPPVDRDSNGSGGYTALFITNPDQQAESGRFDRNGDGIVCMPNQGFAYPRGGPIRIDNNLPY